MADQTITLDWNAEHARFEKEMFGLVRALGFKALKRAKRPKVCWNDMVDDMVIFAWRAWRSLRLRGMEPKEIGVWAISDRAVRSSLQGAVFKPIGVMGDRSWADSIHNKRNGLRVRSNREDWQLEKVAGDGQDESDLLSDWTKWKETLGDDEKELIEALEEGEPRDGKSVKGLSRPKRALAESFREFRAG